MFNFPERSPCQGQPGEKPGQRSQMVSLSAGTCDQPCLPDMKQFHENGAEAVLDVPLLIIKHYYYYKEILTAKPTKVDFLPQRF